MMYTTCLSPSVSLRCRASQSLYLNDPTFFTCSTFQTNPLLISSSSSINSCCCCCCCGNNNNNNLVYNSLPRIKPSFLCNGLRQSSLIQFSPTRRLVVDGNYSFSLSSESDGKSCYKKICSFKDRRRRLGGRRYACRSYEGKKDEGCFSKGIGDDCGDEVELLLDLLTEEVGLESVSVRGRKRVEKKDSSKVSGRAKAVKSGSVKRDLKCDAKVVEVRSSERKDRKLSDERRSSVTGVENKVKTQGSSCSSYYSVSSAGENDSDNDVVIENNGYFVKGESSSEYKDDQKVDRHSSVYDEELEENVERQQEFGKKESEIVKKNAAESYYGNQEWRKKSEKKLNVESSQVQRTERNSQYYSEKSDRITDQSRSGMKNTNASTQKLYSGAENKSSTSAQELTSHRKGETVDITRQNEYKKQSNVNLEASEIRNLDKRMASSSSSSFETRMKNREENSSQVSDRFEGQREDKHQRVVQLASSKESRMKSQQISETSDTHVTDVENTLVTQSDIRTKKQELHDQREEKHQRVDQVQAASSKESRVKSQQISDTRVTNIENTSVSHTQSDIRTKTQDLHLESSSSSEKRENIEDKYSSSQVATVAGPTETTKTGRKTTKASSFHVGMPKETSSSYKALRLNPESSFQETGTHIASADEQHKSAGQFVGEFVEKAKHQLSISEGELAREDDEQHELKSSGESGSGNYDEKDGDMGPSDEMWHESGAPDEQVKRSGRSIWNVIGDVVRLRWGPSRSETHTPKSGGVSNQSTSSERWFSGHEPDELSRKDVSTTSSFKEKQDSPLLISSSNTNQGSSPKSMSPIVIEESSNPLPAIRMRRSPVVKTTSVTGETDASTSGKMDQRVSKPLTQVPVPQTDASGSGKMVTVEPPIPSRRKLARIDQVSKDRFDEWEEAYTVEAKQRKNDEFFMREALSEAKKAADMWEVPVGAVLVQDGKIIARGYNL
ncbi:hypothetical protein M8C21_006030 [Ambrosia artemisiifolia]|uniref:CMP/dCMP-type deaminase domain-containing protein n=1 Tax=Ambrosia artemisiifolia TaxID=4212 RepID=A0AAD5D7B8_AMBAR|nr:hypothetical protein M8C21_006030 [Ambrosia artemisiifolia]